MNPLFNLPAACHHWGRYTPSRAAIRSGTKETSFEELARLCQVISHRVREGSDSGSVAFASRSDELLMAGALGAGLAGRSFVLLRDFFSEAQAEAVIRHTGASLLLHDEESAPIASSMLAVGVEQLPVEPVGTEIDLLHRRLFGHDDVVCYFLTSGTTGIPDVVPKSNYSLVSELFQWIVELQLTRTSTMAVGIPIFHTGGFVTAAAALACGASAAFVRGLHGPELEMELAAVSATHAFLTPAQIASCTRLPPSLRVILSLGEHLPRRVRLALLERFNGELVVSWGNTEGLGTMESSMEVPAEEFGLGLGRPFVTDELFVVGEAAGRQAVVGLIAGQSDNCLMTADEERAGHIVSDDEGVIDRRGRLLFATRRGNRVERTDGSHAPFSEVEDLIETVGGVARAAVFADAAGTLAVAIVRDGAQAIDAVINQVRHLLDPFTSEIGIVFADEIPTTTSGKIDRIKLRGMAGT